MMALSISIIIILGLLAKIVFEKLKLPGLIGMLFVGVIIGPYALNIIDQDLLNISSDLRKIALVIILIRAGLGIKTKEIKKVGKTAVKLSFIPVVLEGLTIVLIAMLLLGFDFVTAGMLGFIIAAVSPAVIVPSMLRFINEKKGEKKGIPVLILASASIDDVIAITLFSVFLGFYVNANSNICLQLLNIPVSIILGVLIGIVVGIILVKIFNVLKIRDTNKVLLILAIAILMTSLEEALKNYILIASLLGVMALGFIIAEKNSNLGARMSLKFNKLWILAEIFLFVLVGAEVNIEVAINAGLLGLIIILIGLIARTIGVYLSTINSGLDFKEKAFITVSFWPKATVQAAIGAIPLSQGVKGGEIILAIAVLSIIITAPLGAILIDKLGPKILDS